MYRGIELGEVVAVPPRWVLLGELESAIEVFKHIEDRIRRLDEELAASPPCRTCGRYDKAAAAARELDTEFGSYKQCYRCGKRYAIPEKLAKAWTDYTRRSKQKLARKKAVR